MHRWGGRENDRAIAAARLEKDEHTSSIQAQLAAKVKKSGKRIAQVFAEFDADGGGTVDYDELRLGLRSLGVQLTNVEFEKMTKIWDQSGSGEINYFEFANDLRDAEQIRSLKEQQEREGQRQEEQ